MKDRTPSRTAAWVAAARGMGDLLGPAKLVDDPYGLAFSATPPVPHLAGRFPPLRAWILYMQVRTRVIDDALRASQAPQVVILGAGYDCRALRLPGPRYFEIDHPATQGHKRRTLERLGAPAAPTYVTWHFERDPLDRLGDALARAGHDPSRPTFTIWEGVTMYLSEPAIDASLRAIRGWSAPGSQVAITYFARSRIERPSLSTRLVQAVVARVGEPWTFGWDPAELPAYLAARELGVLRDVSMGEAARELLPAREAKLIGGRDDQRVCIATV